MKSQTKEQSSSSAVLSVFCAPNGEHTHSPHLERQLSSANLLKDVDGVDVSPDGSEQKEVGTKTTKPADIHPFDLLVVGEEYKLTNFTGSCPGMKGAALVTKDGQAPVFHHDECLLTVKSVDDKGKHIHVKATRKDLKDENCDYGVVGTYELEMIFKKDKTGQIICTSLSGISGKLAIPALVLTPLKAASWLKSWVSASSSAWDDVISYNTGKTEQTLPVSIIANQDGTFQLKATIDPNLLVLEGASYAMLAASNKVGIACPAILEGSVDFRLDKQNRKDGSTLGLNSKK